MANRSVLFKELKLGSLTLANRIIMAPMTRVRCDPLSVPSALMAEHYAQRAEAGLIICEATQVSKAVAFINQPGVYNEVQVKGWRAVTDAVHAKKGTIALQLYHPGRVAHPNMNDGLQPVAPSAVAAPGETMTAKGSVKHVEPRALTQLEVKDHVGYFKKAAENAMRAGFDGVQIHAANGYLVNQFLSQNSNKRQDKYGGSVENRARFLVQVAEAVAMSIGAGRLGVRLSPLNNYNDCPIADYLPTLQHIYKHFNRMGLGFVHLMRKDFYSQLTGDVMTPTRSQFKGALVANMGYTADEAAQSIAQGKVDAVAFGTPFISNPDLPKRFKLNAELAPFDQSTFYMGGQKGYTTYAPLP